ncbi:hypothetical protein OE749_11565 [Aestuariibacter sp. AA17]|uniref:Uncharacterized protein n=1 Tax=Fluctibacter corallii TaxID=2984329 RepID=A0ABT3AAI3_9ALTE|nr:LamG-like jellyroll fold domain-containing protein [Aestuariibacter sp. AA17]MCV2885331.1 hypothetical protein [Aestuariibacter sp. AA17]
MKLRTLIASSLLSLAAAQANATDFSAYYSFEGEANGYKDTSANGNDGYFLNSGKGSYILEGRNGLAMNKDVFVVGSLPAHKKDVPLTLALWVNHDALSAEHTLISKLDASTNQGFSLSMSNSGLRFWLKDKNNNGVELTSASFSSVGWTHIAVTYSGNGKASGVKFYVDGLELAGTTVLDTLVGETNTHGPLYTGASLKNPKPFPGAIDEVLITPRVYNIGQIGCLATFGRDCATASGLGPRGDVGPQGPVGEAGEVGLVGPNGANGVRGDVGPMGDQGPVGPAGDRGDVGPIGAQGAKGANGKNGTDGINGADGSPGAKGPKGRVGPKGPVGDRGATGPAGNRGATGPTGEKGDTGPAGDAGNKGATGARGTTGGKGPRGVTGPKGVTGDRGNTGPKGDTGAKGGTGPKGYTGPTGVSAVSHYGSGLAAEKARKVGPKGYKGDTGPKGYPGQCLCRDRWGRPCIIP